MVLPSRFSERALSFALDVARRPRVACRAIVLALVFGTGARLVAGPPGSIAQSAVVPQLIADPNLLLQTRYPDAGGAISVYARNPWDMQVFNGRIYFAYGNAYDNTGPTPIISYDPGNLATPFVTEFTTDAEQLTRYRIIGGQLVAPDHDPTEDQALGNFYRKEPAGWVKHRTIPGGVHNEDLYSFQGRLFAAIQEGLVPGATDVQISDDNGLTWQNIRLTGGVFTMPTFLVPTLFELAGNLYASSVFGVSTLWRYEGGNSFTQLSSATAEGMFPNTAKPPPLYVERWVPFAGQMVYLGVKSDPDDPLDWLPVGLYSATDVATAQKIALPGAGVAWDLVVSPGSGFPQTLYVLANNAISATQNVVTVYAATANGNLTSVPPLTPLFSFTLSDGSFARSFEVLNGDFYFGVGGSKASPPPSTGSLLRVQQSALPASPTATATSTLPPPATDTATATATLTTTPTSTLSPSPISTPSGTPTPTATPTRTAAPTATRTATASSLPTASATPFAQPNVSVQVAPSSGSLLTTLTARDAGCGNNTLNRRLVALRFTRLTNATVDVPGVGTITAPSATPIAIPGQPATFTLTVRRGVAGQASTVALVVTDGCGDWPTFVGGGPNAF